MSERLEKTSGNAQPAQPACGRLSSLWLILPCVFLALWAGSMLARLSPSLIWWIDLLPFVAAGLATAIFAMILNGILRDSHPQDIPNQLGEGLKELLDSVGPAVAAIDLNGNLLYCNSAAERLTGYRIDEIVQLWGNKEFLAPGEGEQLLEQMQNLCHLDPVRSHTVAGPIRAFLDSARTLPADTIPSFDSRLRAKGGAIVPVKLHLSPLQNAEGKLTGVVVVAAEMNGAQQPGKDHDLIEHSGEMLATLSLTGEFLYANPAWERNFGLHPLTLKVPHPFENLFSSDGRSQAAALFRRALDGEKVERAPLRHCTPDGRLLELELSLSRREEDGSNPTLLCWLRDATRQKRREQRLQLQLEASRIVEERAPGHSAELQLLEALCKPQGWDLAVEWIVDTEKKQLRFATAWGAPGSHTEEIIQEYTSLTLDASNELAGQAWRLGRAVWLTGLPSASEDTHLAAAVRASLLSAWAVPVRSGSQIIAVLEFYSSRQLCEDREALAAIEIVAAALSRLIERAREPRVAGITGPQLEAVLEAVPEGICGLDPDRQVRFANSAAANLLVKPAAGLTGQSLDELLHGAAPADRRCAEDCPLRNPAIKTGETEIYRADGSSFPAEFALTPIRQDGRAAGAVLSFRDISQRSALDRLKDEFISTVSHEMRTPLTSIRGALGLLAHGMIDEADKKAHNLLRIALSNSDRLIRLINDILDLERIQSGREPLNFCTVQLAGVIQRAIDEIQPMASAANVQLIHDGTQVEVTADPDRLLQVVTNLLSNAVKFSPAHSQVSVMLRPGITGVILSVIDHGRGIPADKLETIFGRFQQVDASDARQKGGSGLGLAICRTIVHQHSGRIWAERNPVRGSTLRIFLPYQAAQAGAANFPAAKSAIGTVILADASEESRPRIAAQLARHGYSVVQASTVEQTLTAAQQSAEAILLDTSLDGMNGWEILPLLRRLDTAAQTPVVLLSVDDPLGPPEGTEGLVTKPLREEELLRSGSENARVLVVEDDRDLAHIIGEVFARGGITVQTAHTLQQTIDACSVFQPHLMVLDIGLPDGDGFNVVDWLRQQTRLARLPLVVYSGRDLSPEERSQLILGPTYFLAKTRVQPQQLEALVLTMLRSSRRAGGQSGQNS